MADDPKKLKWHSMDEIKANSLTTSTQYPQMVCAMPLSALPEGIQGMPGLVSAYVSSYILTQAAQGGVSAHGEFAAVRIDAGIGKGYNYVFGVSSNSQSYFSGPRNDIPGHHFDPNQSVPVSSLFIGMPKKRSR